MSTGTTIRTNLIPRLSVDSIPSGMNNRRGRKPTVIAENVRSLRLVCPHDCPDTCALIVTVHDGRAVDLRGDPESPFTRGFLCQKVSRYLERVYHDERLLYPMKRVGPKGTRQFARIAWDEAIDTVARRFREIADSPHGPEAILP